MRKVMIPLVSVMTLSGCAAASSAELSAGEKAAIAAEVEKRVDGYAEAVKQRDTDWFRGYWGDFDGFVVAGDGELNASPESWDAEVRQWVEGVEEVLEFEFFDRHTYVLARDAAVHSTRFRWGIVTLGGDTVRSHGSWTYVFKNFDGVWRVVHSAGTHLPG